MNIYPERHNYLFQYIDGKGLRLSFVKKQVEKDLLESGEIKVVKLPKNEWRKIQRWYWKNFPKVKPI